MHAKLRELHITEQVINIRLLIFANHDSKGDGRFDDGGICCCLLKSEQGSITSSRGMGAEMNDAYLST